MDIVCNTSSNPFKHYTFASKHVKEQCCASEEGQICRAGPPDHYWCQGSAGHDTAWIFEIRPREQNCAPDGGAAADKSKTKHAQANLPQPMALSSSATNHCFPS